MESVWNSVRRMGAISRRLAIPAMPPRPSDDRSGRVPDRALPVCPTQP